MRHDRIGEATIAIYIKSNSTTIVLHAEINKSLNLTIYFHLFQVFHTKLSKIKTGQLFWHTLYMTTPLLSYIEWVVTPKNLPGCLRGIRNIAQCIDFHVNAFPTAAKAFESVFSFIARYSWVHFLEHCSSSTHDKIEGFSGMPPLTLHLKVF